MRIAMLGHKRMPSREGGVEIVVEELATRMASLGHDVTVYSRKGHNVAGVEFDDDLYLKDEYVYKGVKVKQVSTINVRGLAAFSSSFFAMRRAVKDRPDVIHIHAEGPCAMIGIAKRAGVRTVATIHGIDWQRAKWGKFGRFYIKHGEAVAAKMADEIIVLSDNLKRYFKETYNRETHVISNAVDEKKIVPPRVIADKYELEKGSYILFLGRMVPEKGVHYLVEAYKALDTNVKLVIAGGSSDSNSYFDELRTLAKNDSRILFTNFVFGEELEELYSNALVYVLPSDLEGMPISLLEAMAYGRCCLTSDIPECAGVLGEVGRTFKAGDVQDLRSKLKELISSPELCDCIGRSLQEKVHREYSWECTVAKTIALYGHPVQDV